MWPWRGLWWVPTGRPFQRAYIHHPWGRLIWPKGGTQEDVRRGKSDDDKGQKAKLNRGREKRKREDERQKQANWTSKRTWKSESARTKPQKQADWSFKKTWDSWKGTRRILLRPLIGLCARNNGSVWRWSILYAYNWVWSIPHNFRPLPNIWLFSQKQLPQLHSGVLFSCTPVFSCIWHFDDAVSFFSFLPALVCLTLTFVPSLYIKDTPLRWIIRVTS